MVNVRQPSDPWYTVLYRDPYRFWWAPSVITLAALLAVHWWYGFSNGLLGLMVPVVASAIMLGAGGARHRQRSRRLGSPIDAG